MSYRNPVLANLFIPNVPILAGIIAPARSWEEGEESDEDDWEEENFPQRQDDEGNE